MKLRKKAEKELSPHMTVAISLQHSTLALRAMSQRGMERTSKQSQSSGKANLMSGPALQTSKQAQKSQGAATPPQKKELRVGNGTNKAV